MPNSNLNLFLTPVIVCHIELTTQGITHSTLQVAFFIPSDISLLQIPLSFPDDRVAPDSVSIEIKLEAVFVRENKGIAAAQRHVKTNHGFRPACTTLDGWYQKLCNFRKNQPHSEPTIAIFSPLKRGAFIAWHCIRQQSLLFPYRGQECRELYQYSYCGCCCLWSYHVQQPFCPPSI